MDEISCHNGLGAVLCNILEGLMLTPSEYAVEGHLGQRKSGRDHDRQCVLESLWPQQGSEAKLAYKWRHTGLLAKAGM